VKFEIAKEQHVLFCKTVKYFTLFMKYCTGHRKLTILEIYEYKYWIGGSGLQELKQNGEQNEMSW